MAHFAAEPAFAHYLEADSEYDSAAEPASAAAEADSAAEAARMTSWQSRTDHYFEGCCSADACAIHSRD